MLLEPLFSQVYGIVLGLDQFPGFVTYIGGILILAGLYILLVNEGQSGSSTNETEKDNGPLEKEHNSLKN